MKLHKLAISSYLGSLLFFKPLCGQTNTFPASGNVGIGTTAPFGTSNFTGLDIRGSAGATISLGTSAVRTGSIYSWQGATVVGSVNPAALVLATADTERLRIDPAGNVGIGTTIPFTTSNFTGLDVRGSTGATISLGTPAARTGSIYSWQGATVVGSVNPAALVLTTADTERLRIDPAGNVGIGTTNPTQKLSVNGTIRAKEVIVETTGWSDYVFAEGYELESLSSVEAQIKEHKHLPGMPSSEDVAEKGIGLGEMQARLLAKVEELTLHVIAQEKELKQLRSEVGQIPRLKAEISALLKR